MNETDNSESGKKKSIIKGNRLYLYPKGLRIYRKSKGIINPDEGIDIKENLIEKYNLYPTPEYTANYSIKDNNEEEILIIKEFFKRRRKK